MKTNDMNRRDFLSKTTTGIAAASTLASVRATFAAQLAEIPEAANNDDFEGLRREYLLAPEVTYFNHGSIGTIPKIVHEAHKGYLALCETNPWLYMWGGPWEEAREQTRVRVSEFLGCSPDELAFTHNTTEGFSLLAGGLKLTEADEVLFSSMNHPGASQCWHHHAQSRGYSVRQFDFPIRDIPSMSAEDIVALYSTQITDKTTVLVFPHVDNLVGIRYPVKQMAKMAREKGVRYIAVDGAQAVGMIPVNLEQMGVDFYAMSPHKWLQSPKGLGLLYLRKPVQTAVRPMWVTWGQKRWAGSVRIFEDYGTRNVAELLTLGDAVDYQSRLDSRKRDERLQALRSHFREAVTRHPKLKWRSPASWQTGVSLYTAEVIGESSQDLFQRMHQEHGYVFRAFHTPEWNTIRLSLNVYNTVDEIDRFMELIG